MSNFKTRLFFHIYFTASGRYSKCKQLRKKRLIYSLMDICLHRFLDYILDERMKTHVKKSGHINWKTIANVNKMERISPSTDFRHKDINRKKIRWFYLIFTNLLCIWHMTSTFVYLLNSLTKPYQMVKSNNWIWVQVNVCMRSA